MLISVETGVITIFSPGFQLISGELNCQVARGMRFRVNLVLRVVRRLLITFRWNVMQRGAELGSYKFCSGESCIAEDFVSWPNLI